VNDGAGRGGRSAVSRDGLLSGRGRIDSIRGIESIQQALIGEPARRQLRAALREQLDPGWQIGPLSITRAKYRPHKKLAAFYTFPLINPIDGSRRTLPLAVTWSAAGDAFKASPAERTALQAEAGARGLLRPFHQLWGEVPGWGMQFQLWPLDGEFPQLARLGDAGYASTLLHSAGLPSDPSEAGVTQNVTYHVTPIRYRPGERHVLLFSEALPGQSPDPARRLYAKLYRTPQAAARAYRIANRVADYLEQNMTGVRGRLGFRGALGFRGVRPAGWSELEGVVFYPHAPGKALSGQLGRSPGWLAAQLRLTGQALCALHNSPPALQAELEPDSFADEIQVTWRATEYVRFLLPETNRRIADLFERIQALHERLPGEPPTFTHSDFKADHLLASPDGLTLIDFDSCALADPALDVGKFLADLDWWFYLTGVTGVAQAQEAFLQGYAQGDESGRLSRARLYHALILLKITARRARLYSKDWADQVTRMVERAGVVLEEVERRYLPTR
jgi:hypothetical protein